MLRRRNRRREGWEKSKRVTGQREHRHAWEGKWERTKRGGTEEGLHIRHAEEETEIKRRERGGKKRKGRYTGFSRNEEGKSQGPE